MDASIIIRTYNEAHWLPSVFQLLQQQQGATFEVVVVDSGSTDDTVQIARRHGARIVSIAKADFSFGRSLNVGCAAAEGDALVFLSGHCLPVGPHWLRDLIQPLSHDDCAYTYGRQVPHEQITKYSERQIFEKFFPNVRRGPSTDIACNNANAALRRDVWHENRFDEFLTGLEDMELAKRLVTKGFLVAYVADASVVHIHEETWQRVRIRYERESFALQKIIPEIHMTIWDMVRYCSSAIAHDFASALRDRKLSRVMAEVVMFRTMQFWGAYQGNIDHRKLSRTKKEEYYYYSRRRATDPEPLALAGSRMSPAGAGSIPALKAKE